MKVCIIQPPYSSDYSRSEEHFIKEPELLDMGIDTVLTNDYNLISQAVAKRGKHINY